MSFALDTRSSARRALLRYLGYEVSWIDVYQINELDVFGGKFNAVLVVETTYVHGMPVVVNSKLAFECSDCGGIGYTRGQYTSFSDLINMKITAMLHVLECPAFLWPMIIFGPLPTVGLPTVKTGV